MALKARITKEEHGKLSADLQKEYRVGDDADTMILDVTEVDGLKLADVTKMTTALNKERDNVKALNAKLKAIPEGVELDKLPEQLALIEKIKKGELTDDQKGTLKTLEAQLTQKFDQQKAQLEAQLKKTSETASTREASLTKQLRELLQTNQGNSAIMAKKGKAKILQPLLAQLTRVVENGDKGFRLEVIGKDGAARLSPKATDAETLMTLDELLDELKTDPDYAMAFDGDGASGGGGGAARGAPARGTGPYTISSADARDPQKYRAAKAAAEKTGQQLQIA